MARQQLGVAPLSNSDAVTKAYVDNGPLCGAVGTPIGWRFGPQYVLGTGTGTPTAGLMWFTPIWVAETTQTIDSITARVTTAQAGGTATAVYAALYPDDGGGLPDTTTALGSGTLTATAVGETTRTFTTPVALTPGNIYWLGFLYYAGTTAPTTAPVFTVINNNVIPFASPTSVAVGTNVRALTSVATYTALPTSKITNFSANTASVAPYMMLHRSA